MTSVPEQYTEIVKKSQEAVLNAVDTWTKAVQDTFGRLQSPPAPEQVIDQYYDVASKLLATQRDLAKSLVQASAQVAETVRQNVRVPGAAENAEN